MAVEPARVVLQERLAPYVPRLVRRWPGGDRPWCRLEGSLVSADISGFTKLSERLAGLGKEGAEELTDLINDCFDGMIGIAHDHGGDVLKFGGDALLLLFTGPGHAERACDATIGMRASIARPLHTRTVPKVTLRMSQGIHTGEFDLYLVDGGHRELIVTGPGVTATVECEAAADAGEILLSAAAAEAVGEARLGPAKEGGRLLRRRGPTAPYIDLADADTGDGGDDVAAFVPAAQRDQIEADATGEHRRVTIGFVKFSGVDALVDRAGPPEVAARLQALAGAVGEACEAFTVHWLASDVYPGGGKVILTAGAPVSHGDDEDRALRAVRAIVDADVGLTLRAGVNAGHVFVGNLGGRARRTYTVMGDAVNLAARLMQKANAGQVIATSDLLDHAVTRVEREPLEPFTVKGKAKPIDAANVRSLDGADRRQTDDGTALVGRDVELRLLLEAVDSATAGQGAVVEIVAEAGMGKSTLLAALRRRRTSHRFLEAAGGRYAQATPYFAVRGLLRTALGIAPDADRTEAGRQLADRVRAAAPHLVPWVPLLALPVEATVATTAEVEELAPAYRRHRLHDVVVDLLDAVAPTPLVVVVEDGHWLDEASLALVRALAWKAAGRSWALIVTRRPGTQVSEAAPHVTVLPLEPLSPEAARALVAATAGIDLLPADAERIVARAGGRPMFVAELARAAADLGVDELPDSIESLVTVRIDTLPAADRVTLREASVLGAVVDLELASDALGRAGTAGWEALDPFLERVAHGVMRFRHALYHEVAYAGLSYRRRRTVHARVGEAIERRAGDRADDEAALLSLHFHRAVVPEKAWRYSVLAGAQARDKYANVEAADFYRRAIDAAARLDGVDGDAVREVWEALGDVSELAAHYDEAAAAFRAARRLSPPGTAAAVRLLRKEGVVRERNGRYTQALRWYGRARRAAGSLDEDERARAVTDLALDSAGVRYRQGRHRDCARCAREAFEAGIAIGERRAVARASYLLDISLTAVGDLDAANWRGAAVPIFEEIGDLVGLANALNNAGIAAYFEGRWPEALDHYRRSQAARERSGDVVGAATQVNNVGEILSDQGHHEEAVALFEEALSVWRAAHYPVGVAVATGNLGRAQARAGRHDEATALLDDAVRRFSELGARSFVVESQLRQMENLVLAGRHDAALAAAEPLRRALDRGDGEGPQGVVLGRLAGWALLRRGRVGDAVAALRPAIDEGERVGARFEVALTRLALAEALGGVEGDAERALAEPVLAELGVVRVPAVP